MIRPSRMHSHHPYQSPWICPITQCSDSLGAHSWGILRFREFQSVDFEKQLTETARLSRTGEDPVIRAVGYPYECNESGAHQRFLLSAGPKFIECRTITVRCTLEALLTPHWEKCACTTRTHIRFREFSIDKYDSRHKERTLFCNVV